MCVDFTFCFWTDEVSVSGLCGAAFYGDGLRGTANGNCIVGFISFTYCAPKTAFQDHRIIKYLKELSYRTLSYFDQ